MVSSGDVGAALCALVKDLNINTLVIGSTGKSMLQRMMLGSVSEYCIRNAPCAVVVVKNPTNLKPA
jgi:nucleotide-binding universal stress UspA family protein